MTPEGQRILAHLQDVAAERERRRRSPALAERVREVKAYQHRRFERSYADLLVQPRYALAARFFLDDLYGPHDFDERDEQFARVVPALVRLFPSEIVGTVLSLSELHALSERLDSRLAAALPDGALDAEHYVTAWQGVGEAALRERQIVLMDEVGRALDRYTRSPWIRHSLRLMRKPARAAGLGALQGFLERGFDTFRDMGGAAEFLALVRERERELAAALFAADTSADAVTRATGALGQLP